MFCKEDKGEEWQSTVERHTHVNVHQQICTFMYISTVEVNKKFLL